MCKHGHFWYYWRIEFHSASPIQNVIIFWPFLPLRSARPIQDMNIHSANILARTYSYLELAWRIKFAGWIFEHLGVTLHRLIKKSIRCANTIGAVITERKILTPLHLFVMTSPLNKAVASGNGNRLFTEKRHVKISYNLRSPQYHTNAELLCPSRPPSFFVTIYL